MKKYLLALLVLLPGSAMAQSMSFSDMWTLAQLAPALVLVDLKDNTKFQVDSTLTYTKFNWVTGTASAGQAVPFLNLGSYDYVAAAYARNLTGTSSVFGNVSSAELLNGVRLNGVTRPLITKLVNWLTLGNIDKTPLLAQLAQGSSAGINAGHDFNDPNRKKVLFNSVGAFVGVEIAFGSTTVAPVTASEMKGQTPAHWHTR